MLLENVFLLLIWVAGLCALFWFLSIIADHLIEPLIEKHFPDHDDSVGGTMEVQKTCYQCGDSSEYLLDDGRCWRCIRVDPDDVRG